MTSSPFFTRKRTLYIKKRKSSNETKINFQSQNVVALHIIKSGRNVDKKFGNFLCPSKKALMLVYCHDKHSK